MDATAPAELLTRIQDYLGSDPAALRRALDMDEDDNLSSPITPVEDLVDAASEPDEALLERQRAALRSYTDSLPYACESPQEMDERLARIVDMIYVTAKSNQVDLLRGWDGVLST